MFSLETHENGCHHDTTVHNSWSHIMPKEQRRSTLFCSRLAHLDIEEVLGILNFAIVLCNHNQQPSRLSSPAQYCEYDHTESATPGAESS